ncbi:MAG: sensor histidine kinase [Anaerolineales bacterium]|nr:sensor histidine kinase [Anaerolineales bacterium]
MASRQPQAQYEFEIDALVVYQLGEMLISDEVQALLELVKNSYDADASYANIIVQTETATGEQSPMFPDARGYIFVEDDGIGMDWEEIKGGWLTISRSPKREMKRKGQTTAKGRTPIGHKGLGRLGTQRLGRYLEFWSEKRETDVEFYIGVDWGDFRDKLLSQVPAYVAKTKRDSQGTRLLVSGLRAPEVWSGGALDELVKQLSQLISPFEPLRQFEVFLEIDGTRIDLDKVSQSVLDVADLHIHFIFDGKNLHISGRHRPMFLRAEGQGRDKIRQYQELIAVDKGAGFYAFLSSKIKTVSPDLTWEDSPGWFLSFEHQIELADMGEVELVGESAFSDHQRKDEKGTIANPGPFEGEIFVFPRRGVDLDVTDIFRTIGEYRKYLDRLAGIRVFRDGFGIRPFGLEGDDWLGLGKAWTSGGSYYGLRPQNTIGYVALTAAHNSRLEETTSREYFVENAYSRNFYKLMEKVVDIVNGINEKLRRGYLEYRKLRTEQESGITSQTVDTLFTRMRSAGIKSQDLAQQVTATHRKLEDVSRSVETTTEEVVSSPLFHTDEERRVTPLLQEINQTLLEAKSILKQIEPILSETKKLDSIADVIQSDLEYLRDQLVQFSELAGLGITAEALSHEMKIIADGLAARTTNLVAKLRANQSVDPQVLAYTEFVHTTIAGFRKQLSHLDPSLRYVREQREEISMEVFFRNVQEFYRERFGRNGISLVVEERQKNFEVFMNRGKLTQVVDNLLLNSEYWLQEDLRKATIQEAKVHVSIQEPFIEVHDSGRGVSPSVEHQLFQPFVTTKPKGMGRGLGLFINRQLLESSNCSISLLPDRNTFERRYIFRIDFTGVLHNG